MHRFHHREFADIDSLINSKRDQRIAVCIPTLNEASTIGDIVTSIRSELMDASPLVNELLVIDSGSTDRTMEIAEQCGARALRAADISPKHGHHTGKGENLWKALHACDAEILCFIDGDLENFSPKFVSGLLGPLLQDASIDYVKAFYERPIGEADRGGGRVTELLVRPLISLFYPALSAVIQPLAGEYAGRRSLLETLPFPAGYGVEIAHLIDLLAAGKLERCAQVDLEIRIHRNRSDSELGDMAFAILRTIMLRLERDGMVQFAGPLPVEHGRWLTDGDQIKQLRSTPVIEERPAIQSSLKAARSME